jgi:hypothetical protein
MWVPNAISMLLVHRSAAEILIPRHSAECDSKKSEGYNLEEAWVLTERTMQAIKRELENELV